MRVAIQQQQHGYRSGHQLLQSSVRLDRKDQDVIDRLSDMAGPLSPGETFEPYLSVYPLPSLEFYAIARTEQDLDAPRAGCVSTRTLLIPMSYWESKADPAGLVELLDCPTDGDPIELPISPVQHPLPLVDDPSLTELVEALFLEKRSSIVVFGALNPKVIALRLLTAFWPGLRRNFSLCTFALAPRSISGKSFDLLFAPKLARSRFSDWEGRRIEAGGKVAIERHRWTSHVTERLFLSRTPHLLDTDSIGALAADDEGSESALRLTLLWDELRKKATESPTAVLGLVDIASSRGDLSPTWETLEPAIARAVESAANSLDVESAWTFLTTLLGKLDFERLRGNLAKVLWSAGAKLTQRDWRAALGFLLSEQGSEPRVHDLSQSVAVTLGASPPAELSQTLVSVAPDRLLQILSRDNKLLSYVLLSGEDVVQSVLVPNLVVAFESIPPHLRSNYWPNFLPCIRSDWQSALLAALIVSSMPAQLAQAVAVVWGENGVRESQIGDVLCDAAGTDDARLAVRQVFVRAGNDQPTNRCIDLLILPEESDLRWLLDSADIEDRRKLLLDRFVRRTSSRELIKALPTTALASKALSVLGDDVMQYLSSVTRLATLPTIPFGEFIFWGKKVFPSLQGSDRATLAREMLNRAVTEDVSCTSSLLAQMFEIVAEEIDSVPMIKIGLATTLNGQSVSRTLAAFDSVAQKIGDQFAKHANLVVNLLVGRRTFDLTDEGALMLGKFLERAARVKAGDFARACRVILPFAMSARKTAASPVIVACFPVVLDELRRSNDGFDLMKAIFLGDWDKCKSARRDLVRAFMYSSWSPVDLATTAFRTGEPERVFKRLLKEPDGARYLNRIEEDLHALDDGTRKPILEAIAAARGSGSYIPDRET
jgi:hypothetical protein